MLTDRQKLILQAIVLAYTETGHAVGSKKLVEMLSISVSSATIRNEMATLEEIGLIQKEHTSSGRIPSLAGYRYYVDHLKHRDILVGKNDLSMIRQSLDGSYAKVDEIIANSTNMLSELTSYTALAIKPEISDVRLSGFRLVPLGNHQVLAILVTDSGEVESQQFAIGKDVSGEQLEAIVRIVNDQLVGQPLRVVLQRLLTDIPTQITQYLETPDGFLQTFGQALDRATSDQFFVGGRLNLLDFSSIDNPTTIKDLYQLLSNKTDMHDMMLPNQDNTEVSVKIGDEIANDLLKNYSLLTATYDVGNHGRGMIAILGPTRMSYSRTIGLLGAFKQELTNKLINYYQFYDE
ncbi:heat-inducible transcriptional repressor HrcA [Periweissella ghanensis]|uniref:Heat-inducible transcription repressor HrcA n=1 Tax=Periweissella ghanensis TaxID=467997 RepID=A0ABM8ZDQ4_9LACO|nr:heat-inducible transcriptional repressor HrcA [Periweissella ghanensis]MCM0600371.1 heat-inducible transcriptional repressor HrcA [Periweissella ghanensis]CAH0419317.1 Heat-inducible transcription repressor HrcA [Periweissella ghanensis]